MTMTHERVVRASPAGGPSALGGRRPAFAPRRPAGGHRGLVVSFIVMGTGETRAAGSDSRTVRTMESHASCRSTGILG